MPPRSLSASSDVGVLPWDDSEIYEPVLELKGRSKESSSLTRSVRIAEEHEIFYITHIDEFSDEEVAAIWYEANDYANMKLDYKSTVFLMECGKPLPGDEHTCRGLEYRTQDGAWARYENKRDAYNAVLDEQDLQWKKDIDDPEALSRVYLQHSTKCAVAAAELGKQDAIEAQKIYESYFNQDNTKRVSQKKNGSSLKRMCGIKV
jgi:hypothetical protein